MQWLIIGTAKSPILGFTDRQMTIALKKSGHEVVYVDEGNLNQIPALLDKYEFDIIYWEAGNGWKAWPMIKQAKCKKVNVWYDDPVMRMDYNLVWDQMFEGSRAGVKIMCWDSFWIEEVFREHMIEMELCHLAALDEEYYAAPQLACDQYPVFIANLHSVRKIEQLKSILVEPFLTIVNSIENDIKKADNVPSWDYLERRYAALMGPGERQLFADLCLLDPQLQYNFRSCIWAISKNEVRVRMLKEALKVSKVIMFSETKQLHHANEHEVRYMLGPLEHKLTFHDTTGCKAGKLGVFYHWGWVHLQATDPQSVNEGFPYRIFQTMASGKCLLTDQMPKWKDHLVMGTEVVAYDSLEEMKEKLSQLLNNKSLCRAIGSNARKAFEDKHQWKHRIERIANEKVVTQESIS